MPHVTAIRHLAFEDLGAFEPLLETMGFHIQYLDAGVDDLGERHERAGRAEWIPGLRSLAAKERRVCRKTCSSIRRTPGSRWRPIRRLFISECRMLVGDQAAAMPKKRLGFRGAPPPYWTGADGGCIWPASEEQ